MLPTFAHGSYHLTGTKIQEPEACWEVSTMRISVAMADEGDA